MPSRSLRVTLLLAVAVLPLAACIVEPYHHRDYYRERPVYVPAPPVYVPQPGYYRGY